MKSPEAFLASNPEDSDQKEKEIREIENGQIADKGIKESGSQEVKNTRTENNRDFLEKQRGRITEARQKFQDKNLDSLVQATKILRDILDDYNRSFSEDEGASSAQQLPWEVFQQVIGEQYIKEREEELKKEGDRHGLYLPANEKGGGDLLKRQSDGGRVGEVTLFDLVGHGQMALGSKVLVDEFFRRREADPSYDRENLFYDLDAFVSGLPMPSSMLSLTVAELERGEKNINLKIEQAGDTRVFVRDNQGRVRVLEIKKGYPPLGYSFLGNTGTTGKGSAEEKGGDPGTQRVTTEFTLEPETKVFLTSDGLFDVKTGNITENTNGQPIEESLGTDFAGFCEQYRNLGHEDFRQALAKYVRQAKQEETTGGKKKVEDDVTVLML